MEDELETILENITDHDSFNETRYHYERPLHVIIHEVCIFTVAVVSLIADLLIVCIVAKNKRMHTKRNFVIMNVALSEALFLFTIPSFFSRLLDLFDLYLPRFCDCILVSTEFTYLVGTFLLLFVLSIPKIIESQKFTIRWILAIVYAIILTITLIDATMCLDAYFNPIVYISLLITYSILLLTVVINDGIYYCKGTILEAEFKLGYNLARITAYNWFICILVMIVSSAIFPYQFHFVFVYVWLTGFSNGTYMLIYLIRNDADYKVCFYNLFKRIDNEATVSFADDFNNPVDEPGTVSININKNSNANATDVN